MKMTISGVSPQARQWDGPNGKVYFYKAFFLDGSQADAGAKSEEEANKAIAALTALIGKENEFEIERKQQDYEGHPAYKLKGYPGKERSGGGFGGSKGNWQPRFEDSEEGFWHKQRSIFASVAYQKAVDAWLSDKMGKHYTLEEAFQTGYNLLCSTIPSVGPKPATPPTPHAEPQPHAQQAVTDYKGQYEEKSGARAGWNETDAPCDVCFCPPGKRHATHCSRFIPV